MTDLAITVDRTDAAPLAAQIVDAVRTAVLAGTLAPGDTVPSSRSLAASLGVSRGVVVTAYDQLTGEGYLDVSQGAAARVAAVDTVPTDRRPATPHTPPAGDEAPPAVDMRPGFPSTARLDERAWRSAWRQAAARPVPTRQADDFGTASLREQIADHVRQARGVACDAADILVTAGTSEAVMMLALALGELHPQDSATTNGPTVAMEDPGYPSSRRALERFGCTVVPIPVDDDGLRMDLLAALDPAPHAVLLTPSHQYPLGGRLPVSARLEALAWAEKHDAVIIEDDYDSEFRHGAATLPALATLDRSETVALIGSFSKVLTPWLRLGYIVLPRRPALHAALHRVRADVTAPIAGVAQEAMAALLASGAVRRHIAAVRRDYAHRRGLVIRALGDVCNAGSGARLRGLEGGLHAVVELGSADAAARVSAIAASEGVAVADLGDYAASPAASVHQGIVFGYAAPTDLELAKGLTVLRAAIAAEIRSPRRPGPLPE
ncbi:PLP-dependent aminotransferase family protein [Leifsonia sp. YIM 134122]|uniref:PLP-dependent aminotransferase family protein n=1 Tax=Leifsonia stereocauli TaxID=3134136 RepID=A0ABU9VZR1_9MICO